MSSIDYKTTNNISFDAANQSAFATLETSELTPLFQCDFVYGLNNQIWEYIYTFTVTDPTVDPTYDAIYTNNNAAFIVIYNSGTTLVCRGSSSPAASGTLTKVSGTGDATITYSAFTTSAGVVSGASASVDTNSRRLRIQSGTSSSGYAYIISRRNFRYRAGQGTVVRFTPIFTSGVANSIQIFGVGTIINNVPYDGYFYGYNGTSLSIFHYIDGSLASGFPIAQSQWNGDKVNGSSGTAFTLDPTKGTPVMIKYPYLGYGNITFWVQNPQTSAWVLIHTIKYANSTATTQISNPSLNFIGYTLNSGNTNNLTMYCGSIGVFLSGVRSFVGNPSYAIDHNKSSITTETNIISIRNAYSYNGVLNKGQIRLRSIVIGSTAALGVACVRLKIGATLGGTPSFTPVSGSTANNGITITSGNSIASYNTAGTTISGGTYITSFYIDNPDTLFVDMEKYNIFIAPGEILTISVFSTISTQSGISVNWSEDI